MKRTATIRDLISFAATTLLFAGCGLTLPPTEGGSTSARPQEIGNGRSDTYDSRAVALIPHVRGLKGGGIFVKHRCILTAGHVVQNRQTDQVYLPLSAVQTMRAGQNVETDLTAPSRGIIRISSLHKFTPRPPPAPQFDDLGFAFTHSEAPRLNPNDRPLLDTLAMDSADISFADITYGTPDRTRGDVLKVIGYSRDCGQPEGMQGVYGIQRYGSFRAFNGTLPLGVSVPDVQTMNKLSALEFVGTGDPLTKTCPGDSGGPIFKGDNVVSVITGADRTDPTLYRGTHVSAYQPWIEERMRNFCNPRFKIRAGAANAGLGYKITGDAYATVTTGRIINCDGSDTEVCERGMDVPDDVSNPPDLLAGVGRVDLVASDVPGAAFWRWQNAGPPGSLCPCVGYQPGQDFTSRTCTVLLIEDEQPHSNEQPQPATIGDYPNTCIAEYRPSCMGSPDGGCPEY